MLLTRNTSRYFRPEKAKEEKRFSHILQRSLSRYQRRPIIILCIGSDRATGDCLGPLIGYRLTGDSGYPALKYSSLSSGNQKVIVYGTLSDPVHAGNLSQRLSDIHNHYYNPYIVAIDASLGVPEHVGYVTLGQGSLSPGTGVSHPLPPAGDIHITGIVNASSENNLFTLQTTRLSVVTTLADFIAKGLLEALHVRPSF